MHLLVISYRVHFKLEILIKTTVFAYVMLNAYLKSIMLTKFGLLKDLSIQQ